MMESIQDHLEKLMNSSDMGEKYRSIMKNYVFNDPDVIQFINENRESLDNNALVKSASKLYEFVNEKKKFAGRETGLVPGYYPKLIINNNRVEIEYVPSKEEVTRRQNNAINNRIHSFFMPKDIHEANLESIEITESRKDAILKGSDFIDKYKKNPDEFNKGLYLFGSFGVGKTYLLGAIAKELSEYGYPTTLVHFPTFAVEMKNSIGDNTTGEKLEVFKRAEILMLDDIGADTMSSWIRDDVLGVILQHRMQEQLPTFFSSNFGMKQLEEEHLKVTQRGEVEPLKASRIMERIKYLSEEIKMSGKNRRLSD